MNEQHPSASDHPDMEQWRERVKKVFIGLDLAEDRLFETSDLNTRVEIKERLDEVRVRLVQSVNQLLSHTIDLEL